MTDDVSANMAAPAVRSGHRKGGLGRGLDALIPGGSFEPQQESAAVGGSVTSVPIDSIEPNPWQPRAVLDPERLEELADSIRVHGVIQPVIVNRGEQPGRYILIAGERRWRASRIAGLAEVPVVIKDVASQAMLEIALVENVVRADLSPLEEAIAYKQLIDEFGLTQASVATRVGRSRVTVTNTLRLLNAPAEVQAALQQVRITEGHARALLGLPSGIDQVAMLRIVEERQFNVRQTEDAVRKWTAAARAGIVDVEQAERKANPLRHIEDQLRRSLSTKVAVRPGPDGDGGTITIHFFTDEQLNGILRRLVEELDF